MTSAVRRAILNYRELFAIQQRMPVEEMHKMADALRYAKAAALVEIEAAKVQP